MKKTVFAALLVFTLIFALCACQEHEHSFSDWTDTIEPSCEQRGLRERFCYDCDYRDTEYIEESGHTEQIDEAVAATCIAPGKTQGSHCSVCGIVIAAQQDTQLAEHTYTEINITKDATCLDAGTREIGCRDCDASYEEEYNLTELDASTVYDNAMKFVGEIITYDKNGDGLAIGTGFVYSSDGEIVTNYHVIEDAYSADITIGEQTYDIQSVLAYDADIDLAVLKIDASGLEVAPVCSKANAVGKTIYALGSSKGLTGTFSQGIVTYSDRVLDNVSYIQHDAAISGGNSGGPLLNAYGEVVAVNTMTRKDSQNLNFAVSVGELSKLTYGTPVTLEELFGKSVSADSVRDAVISWVIQNGEEYDGYYEYYYEYDASEGYTVYYRPDKDYLTIDMYYFDEMDIVFSLYLDEGTTDYFYILSVYEGDEEICDLYGELDATNYTENAPLKGYEIESYDSFTATVEGEEWAADLCVLSLNVTLDFFDWFLPNYDLGNGIEDFGFVNY